MDRKKYYKRLAELIDPPTDRNDILAKRLGTPMKKMTYRETCIDYVKKTMRCVGYRDYIVAELEKLEKIEQIVNNGSKENGISSLNAIRNVLESEG